MRTIILDEEVDAAISRHELDDHAALLLDKSGHFDVEFPTIKSQFKYIVRSKGWVGHIPVGGDIVVNVRPKLPISNLFGMLEIAYNLKSFELLDGEISVNTIDELFERVASILARRVLDRARKGLFQAYLSERDDLPFVRGKIDIRENMKRSMQGSPYLHCEFQQLTYDLEDNQILLWTLYRVSRARLQRPDVVRAVRQAYRVLSGVVTLQPRETSDCINRFYHRLNEDYRLLHGLCRLLLEHLGPDIALGGHNFLPFQLNMPRLFESFVAEWLKKCAPSNWLVSAQHNAKLEANAELTFKIDLVLKARNSGRSIAVLDTKYKVADVPTEADIQQVVAYAVEIGVKHALLVYPGRQARPLKARVGDIDVNSLSFDISSALNSAGQRFLYDLTSILPPDHAN